MPKLAEVNNHVPNHKVWARTLSCHCLSSPHMSYVNSQACMMSTKRKSTSLEPAFYAALPLRIKATLQQHSSKGRRQRSSSSDHTPLRSPNPRAEQAFEGSGPTHYFNKSNSFPTCSLTNCSPSFLLQQQM